MFLVRCMCQGMLCLMKLTFLPKRTTCLLLPLLTLSPKFFFSAIPSFTSSSSVQISSVPRAVPSAQLVYESALPISSVSSTLQDPNSPLPSSTSSSTHLDISPPLGSIDPIIPPLSMASPAPLSSHPMVTRSKTGTFKVSFLS
jgi:hypothetical protein